MSPSTRSALFFAALLAVVILIVLYAAHVLLVIFAGILFAVFLNVLSESLRGIVPVSPVIATIIVIVSLVGITVVCIWLLSPRVAQQAAAPYEITAFADGMPTMGYGPRP